MKLSKITKSTFEFLGAKFTIKNLLSGDIMSISDAANSATIELKEVGGEYLPSRTISSSSKVEKCLTIQKAIVGWVDVSDGDGKEIVCDAAGKKRFCDELDFDVFNDFYRKLSEEREKLSGVADKQRGQTVKNS